MLILVAAVVAGLAVLVAVNGLVGRSTTELDDRLERYGQPEVVALTAPRPRSPRELIGRLLDPLNNLMARTKRGSGLQEQLLKADLKLRVSEFYVLQAAMVLLLGAAFALRTGMLLVGLVGAVLGYFAPGFYVRYRQRKRLKKFDKQLADALLLLANALKAGYSFAQSIDAVANSSGPPISEEFARTVRETNLGQSVEDALDGMVRRIPSEDLDLMVTAVSIHRQIGGNLAEILENIALTIRERVRIKGEISTLTAQARASGWITTLLPIGLAVLLTMVSPAYFQPMLRSPLGLIMLGLAGFSILMGNAIIRKIVAIEV